jgi:hypothetical protein
MINNIGDRRFPRPATSTDRSKAERAWLKGNTTSDRPFPLRSTRFFQDWPQPEGEMIELGGADTASRFGHNRQRTVPGHI